MIVLYNILLSLNMAYEISNYDVEDYIHFIVGVHIILFSGIYLCMGIISSTRKICNHFNKK